MISHKLYSMFVSTSNSHHYGGGYMYRPPKVVAVQIQLHPVRLHVRKKNKIAISPTTTPLLLLTMVRVLSNEGWVLYDTTPLQHPHHRDPRHRAQLLEKEEKGKKITGLGQVGVVSTANKSGKANTIWKVIYVFVIYIFSIDALRRGVAAPRGCCGVAEFSEARVELKRRVVRGGGGGAASCPWLGCVCVFVVCEGYDQGCVKLMLWIVVTKNEK